MKRKIKIQYRNGLNESIAKSEILNELTDEFYFEEDKKPDFILFGPYGNDIPPQGEYIRVGYFCENIKPDFSICEWAFGIPREEDVNHPRYKRIQWHGLNPVSLIKEIDDNYIDRVLSEKNKFCNFLYSNQVPYRETFFKQLSKYKKIDAPGKSMNNMPSIDSLYTGNIWERKRQFLRSYKFTIAFENYCFPGYQTEKLYDAMRCDSLPIYCGDPCISEIFNKDSFINTSDYVNVKNTRLISWLERNTQSDFGDIRPQFFKTPYHRIKRKSKELGRNLKMKLQFDKLNFNRLIDRIIELDRNEDLYIKHLREPWFNNNTPPPQASTRKRWMEIFSDSR